MEHSLQTTNLADILERVLDKGIVIAGDITISLVEIDLLTIKLRLLIASVDKAKELGINWWETDPQALDQGRGAGAGERRAETTAQPTRGSAAAEGPSGKAKRTRRSTGDAERPRNARGMSHARIET